MAEHAFVAGAIARVIALLADRAAVRDLQTDRSRLSTIYTLALWPVPLAIAAWAYRTPTADHGSRDIYSTAIGAGTSRSVVLAVALSAHRAHPRQKSVSSRESTATAARMLGPVPPRLIASVTDRPEPGDDGGGRGKLAALSTRVLRPVVRTVALRAHRAVVADDGYRNFYGVAVRALVLRLIAELVAVAADPADAGDVGLHCVHPPAERAGTLRLDRSAVAAWADGAAS